MIRSGRYSKRKFKKDTSDANLLVLKITINFLNEAIKVNPNEEHYKTKIKKIYLKYFREWKEFITKINKTPKRRGISIRLFAFFIFKYITRISNEHHAKKIMGLKIMKQLHLERTWRTNIRLYIAWIKYFCTKKGIKTFWNSFKKYHASRK